MAASTTASPLGRGARITGAERERISAQVVERYGRGESIRSMAGDLGRSYGWVQGLLKEAGVTLRGRGGATRGVAGAQRARIARGERPAAGRAGRGNNPQPDVVEEVKVPEEAATPAEPVKTESEVPSTKAKKVKKPKADRPSRKRDEPAAAPEPVAKKSKIEKPAKVEKADKPAKPAKIEKTDKVTKIEKTAKPAKVEKADKPAKPAKRVKDSAKEAPVEAPAQKPKKPKKQKRDKKSKKKNK